MKTINNFRLLIIAILFTIASFMSSLLAQNGIEVGIWQDPKLAFFEDSTGSYQPFTLDILTKVSLQGRQQDAGFFSLSALFEYADLEGIYKRYGVDLGFTFTESISGKLEVTPSINWGFLDRWGRNFMVFGADLEITYDILEGVKFSYLAQLVHRKDLLWAYGDNKIGFSNFLGLTFKVFNK